MFQRNLTTLYPASTHVVGPSTKIAALLTARTLYAIYSLKSNRFVDSLDCVNYDQIKVSAQSDIIDTESCKWSILNIIQNTQLILYSET